MEENAMHHPQLVAYAVLEHGGREFRYCLTNCEEVDDLNQKIQSLIECQTGFSVGFSKGLER